MSSSTFPYPVDDIVARNPFRGQEYQPTGIPPFTEARPLLPQPVLPGHALWQEMYWRAWEIGWSQLHKPGNDSGLISNFIHPAFNERIFMWDSAFMVQFGVYGRRAFDFMGTLDNFYARQHNDGYICREIDPLTGHDYFYPFDPNGTGPNVLAWAEWRVFRHTRDESRIGRVFWPLLALHNWFRAHRTWPNGLYWATGLSSGMDNQLRIPGSSHHHGHWTWVDANMQASLNCWVLSKMANVLEENELTERLVQERAHLLREINTRLWRDSTGFYHDIDAVGQYSPGKSIGAYWGLLDKNMIPEDRLTPFVRHLHERTAFNRPHRVPSLSADSPTYDPETGNYWRGGVWSPTNYVVLKGLRTYGRTRLAHQIAVNHLENVARVFQHTDTFWENYAAEKPAPSKPSSSDFVGWTGLTPISILLEDVVGISVDWPLRRVTWDRRLDTALPYGILNYPLGNDGTLDIVGDDSNIEISTDVSFNLMVLTEEETVQTAVPAGASNIAL